MTGGVITTGWYDHLLQHDGAAENPFGLSILAEGRKDRALEAWLSAGGSLVAYLEAQPRPDAETGAHRRAVWAEIEASMARRAAEIQRTTERAA